MRRLIGTISIVLFPLILVVLGFLYVLYQRSNVAQQAIVIPRGSSILSVSEILHRNQVVQHPTIFRWLLRLTHGSSKVRAGEFLFTENPRMIDALMALYYSEPMVHQVTVPEGWTVRQIAEILARTQLVNQEKFVTIALSKDTAAKYKLDAPSIEGYLFPDTYFFSKVDGEEKILDRMVHRFFERWSKGYVEESRSKGWTIEQLVTLASIVEKETGVKDDRTVISSVFHNRLEKKMRLESDPTTIYGILNFDGNLTRAHLRQATPYNTYVIYGLPPGPIANPGFDALLAALRPAKTSYLYFVSNNQGKSIFSKTYAQHAREVEAYQSSRRAQRAIRSKANHEN